MSVKVMSQVWESEGLSPTERLILLSLADHADDAGTCYPSIKRLSHRTGLSERAVQGALKRLSDAGWLEIRLNAGPRGCNMFTVSPPQEMHPAGNAPPQQVPGPPQQVRQTPAAGAPEPSGTVKNRQGARESVLKILLDVLSEEVAQDFIDHRKAMRKPMTPRAARLIADKLRSCSDPSAIANLSIMNGWQGVFPEREAQVKPGSQPERAERLQRWAKMAKTGTDA
jgi:hypothetical protein